MKFTGNYDGITRSRQPWAGEVCCGNDPYLRARLVNNLIVRGDPHGKETATWEERPRP